MKALDCQLLEYSDSAFTNPHEVVSPTQPEDRQGRFTHMGAQYWGFETSRHVGTRLLEDGQGFIFDPNASHFFNLKEPSTVGFACNNLITSLKAVRHASHGV